MGNTGGLAREVADLLQAEIIDLQDLSISYFDYEHKNSSDDFTPLIDTLVASDFIIFATPVYWYSMSAQLKTFFDRFTDLLTINKETGRRLRGKPVAVLATGTDATLPLCFTSRFELIAGYLGLTLCDTLYCCCPDSFSLPQHQDAIGEYVDNILRRPKKVSDKPHGLHS